jgi:hypothetical protein
MALPLPKVVADVEAGGPLVTSMRGVNALTASNLENQIKRVQAQYAPLTTQAEAASKLAYANLMGPQFMAKLMGHPEILANMSEDQRNKALNMVYGAGTGQGTGNNFMNNLPHPKQEESLFGMLKNKLGSIFTPSSQGSLQSPAQAPQNAPMGSQQTQMPQQQFNPQDVQAAVQAYRNSPEAQQKAQAEGMYTIPNQNELMNWYQKNGNAPVAQPPIEKPAVTSKSWPEKYGEFKGIEKEGEKLGELRASAIDEFGEQYQQAIQAEQPVQHLMEMTQNPIFINMRNKIPFFQDKQLAALSKLGTPQEQQLVGDFVTTATNAVANTINNFRGRILDKEITMANQMKISPNDTWNVMVGKLGSIATFNEMTKQRAYIAGQLMEKKHMNRAQAVNEADRMVDGKAIRKEMEGKLNPKPSDADIDYMAQKYNISPDEVRKKLQAKGLL